MSKWTENIQQHAMNRMTERYKIVFTPGDYQCFCDLIHNYLQNNGSDQAKPLYYAREWYSHWAVFYRGQWIPVVFDHLHDKIVTVLTPDAFRQKRYRRAVTEHGIPVPATQDRPLGFQNLPPCRSANSNLPAATSIPVRSDPQVHANGGMARRHIAGLDRDRQPRRHAQLQRQPRLLTPLRRTAS